MALETKREQPYALYFFILSLLIIALSFWVIWFETIELRPWKSYQAQYFELKGHQLQSEYDMALREFQSPGIQQK